MYGSLQELCELEEKSGKPFWKIVQEDDCREQGITEEVSFEQMRAMYQAMKDADARYDEKLKSESGLVGTEGKKMMEARAEGTLLCGDFIGKVMEKALKTSESNACMKRIVAAPPAGSCGVVPAVFLSLQEEKGGSTVCSSRDRRSDRRACFSGRCSGRLSGRDRFCVCDGSGRSCAFIRRQCKRDRKCSGTGFKKSVGTCL